MRVLPFVLLLALAASANSSLLEMSRSLWTKVLEGGLTKIGALDPLRVPVVKVDQSEGNTSYRMVLRNLEIIGLNSSTLESVHIGRGRLRTNLSEHEAGYVSYTDQRELDTIRYRFHTVVKEPKGLESENLEVKSIPDLDNSKNGQGQYGRVRNYDRTNYESSSRYQDDRRRTGPQGQGSNHESSSRYQEDQQRAVPQGQGSNYESSSRYQNNRRRPGPQGQGSNDESPSRYQEDQQRAMPQGQGSNYESSLRYQESQQRAVPQGQGSNYDSSSRYQNHRQRPGLQGQGSNDESSSRYQEDQQRAMPQGQGSNYETSSRYQNNRQRPGPQGQGSNDESSSRYQEDQQSAMPQGQGSRYESSSRYQENRQRTVLQGQGSSSRYPENRRVSGVAQAHRSNYEASRTPEDQGRHYSQAQNSRGPSDDSKVEHEVPQGQESSAYAFSRSSAAQQTARYSDGQGRDGPGNVRIVYAERLRSPEEVSETRSQRPANDRSGVPSCVGSCQYIMRQGNAGVRNDQREGIKAGGQSEEIGVAASMNFESRRAFVDARVAPARRQGVGENRYAANFERQSNDPSDQGRYQGYTEGSSSRLENQPGYVDIVYADGKEKETRHFGNMRVEQGKDTTVYGLEDVLRDLRDHKRFIVHNFTEGEALTKKNDAVRAASETKRIKDMVRYAKEYQEKQGFYEQGMQLIYHYGDREDDDKSNDKFAKRNKRAHLDEETEDDVMHVIMRIRVPMLRVNAGYVLMGKVGKQVLRGNGLLAGNFTEVIGDFTLELKKVGEDTMIVRAARARLSAEDRNITLQGMDEEGPVKEILTHGLLAAEAVAAMLADDLATKALTEKTADSIIYKMYKNLPVENS